MPVVLVAGDNGNAVPLQLDAGGDLKVVLTTSTDTIGVLATGSNAIGKLAAQTGAVDIGDVDVTSLVPGTVAAALGKAEDAGHTSGDTGVMMLAVRRDADTSEVTDTADYAPLLVDSTGKLKVEMFDGGDTLTVASHAVTNAGTFATQATLQAGTAEFGKLAAGTAEIGNIKNAGTFATQATLQAGTAEFGKLAAGTAAIGSVIAAGDVAHDAADGGNPVKIGGKGVSTDPSKVAVGDRVDAWFDRIGRLVVVEGHPDGDGPAIASLTLDATPVTIIAAPASGTAIWLTGVQASNGDSALQLLEIKDGAGGTVKKTMWLAADGGGYTARFVPHIKLTSATLCQVDISTDISANNVKVNLDYYIADDTS